MEDSPWTQNWHQIKSGGQAEAAPLAQERTQLREAHFREQAERTARAFQQVSAKLKQQSSLDGPADVVDQDVMESFAQHTTQLQIEASTLEKLGFGSEILNKVASNHDDVRFIEHYRAAAGLGVEDDGSEGANTEEENDEDDKDDEGWVDGNESDY